MIHITVESWLGADNKIGVDIWQKKYCNDNETFDEWLDRVSGGNIFVRQLIAEKKFLFGGRTLANRGIKDRKLALQNCATLPQVGDSIDDIYNTARNLAKMFSVGMGVGLDISGLSPRGSKINNAARTTTGAASFMKTFDFVGDVIGAEGRRAALLLCINDRHPDLQEFIQSKSNDNEITNANISVMISDAFMKAAKYNSGWWLSFKRHTGEKIEKKVSAKDVMDTIVDVNYNWGEPGLLMWDTIKKHNMVTDENFEYAGVNACSEACLPAYGACNLGSMNIAEYVDGSKINYRALHNDTMVAFRAMNDVLFESVDMLPFEEQKEVMRKWRINGMGMMGFATALINMGISYGSVASKDTARSIQSTILNACVHASALDVERYGQYEGYDYSRLKENRIFNRLTTHVKYTVRDHGLSNAIFSSIAPTGSLANMIGVSNGVEPHFAMSYTRTTKSLHKQDVEYEMFVPEAAEYLLAKHGIAEPTKKDVELLPAYFTSAHDIDPRDKISIIAAFQEYCDGAISNTLNLPNDITKSEMKHYIIEAWMRGLKGLTFFRNGCKRGGILTTEQPKQEVKVVGDIKPQPNLPHEFIQEVEETQLKRGDIICVDDDLTGLKRKLMTGCGSLHCLAYFDPTTGELLETYLSKGSEGGCENSLTAISRMISISSRAGVPIESIADQLNSTGSCSSYAIRRATKKDTSKGSCCASAVGFALMDMYEEMQTLITGDDYDDDVETEKVVTGSVPPMIATLRNSCPECNEELVFEGGCISCKHCAFSRCD